ncbi:MAG: hypothetical protein WCD15_02465 [Terriglobales bacterium]
MKGFGFLLFPILAIVLMLGGSALAQNVGDNSRYFVAYYSNANTAGAPDQTVRLINDGDTGGTLWASFYVFDDSQELQECCGCPITPDGLLSESVNEELTANSLTGKKNTRGVIKIISSSVPADFTNVPTAGLRGSSTHVQRATPTAGAFHVTETSLPDSNLSSTEETSLETSCGYLVSLGSGQQGICACTPEDDDF